MDATLSLIEKIKTNKNDNIEKCKDIASLLQLIRSSDPKEALRYSLLGLKISEAIGYGDGAACFHDNLGLLNIFIGNYFDALNHFSYAIKHYEQLLTSPIEESYRDKTIYRLSTVKSNIGIAYDNLGLFNESLKLQQFNLEYYKRMGLHKDVLLTTINISSIYHNSMKYQDSINILSFFSEYYKSHRLTTEILLGLAYVNLAAAQYYITPSRQKDLTGYSKALRIFKKNKNQRYERLVYKNYAEHYESIGKYDLMEKYANKVIEINEQTGLNEQQDLLYKMLYKYYKKQSNNDKAFKYLELYEREVENKKKSDALISSMNKDMQLVLDNTALIDSKSNFPYTEAIDLKIPKGSKSINILRISSVEFKHGITFIVCHDGEEIPTQMSFKEMMKLISDSSYAEYFFCINARSRAVNLFYRGVFNKKDWTLELRYKNTTHKIKPEERAYYRLLEHLEKYKNLRLG